MTARVLLIGLGDLGQRLATGLAGLNGIGELLLAGRRAETGVPLARLLAACGEARVRFLPLDASDGAACEQLLRRHAPDLIIHCACRLSPWYLTGRPHPAAEALRAAGFAAQLPAQLPLLMTVMTAVRTVGFTGPVVNCSYPDVTHPILAHLGLAPTIGIGNVGMMAARVRTALREQGSPVPLVRVLGHHSQVTPVVLSRAPEDPLLHPRVYLGEEGRSADEWAFAGGPLVSDRSLNALSAADGLRTVMALLPGAAPLRTSAPGPLGLPGGHPVRLSAGRVELDYPEALTPQEALTLQQRWARLDGLARIEGDGTAVLTEESQAALRQLDPALAEPLSPAQAAHRCELLLSRLDA
jgi:hypothetical protein